MKRTLFFLASLFTMTVFSQEATDTLTPVELKAVRANATAPFAKTNLSKKEIEKQNLGQDLPFLLNQTPSVVVNSDAGTGIGYTGIRIRGTDPTRINMTLNGIPYNDAESQGLFFVNLPDFASSVSSIQIQRGVGTSTNGPGAFGATLNLSTNQLHRDAYAEFNNSYGSFNTWKNSIRAGTGLLGDHFTTDVRLSRITSDGYIDRARTDLHSFYFSSAYLSDKSELRLNIFSGKEKTYQAWNGIPEADLVSDRTKNYSGTEKPGTPYENETDNYNQDHFQFFYNQKISGTLSFSNSVFLVKGRGYYEQYKAGESYSDYGLLPRTTVHDTIYETDLVRQLWLDNDYYGDVFSLQYHQNKTRLNIGGSVTRYSGNHIGEIIWAQQGLDQPKERWYLHPAKKNDASFYTKWQQQIGKKWELFADAQFRTVRYNIKGFRDNPGLAIDNRYQFFNPKLGVTYQQNNWTAYASYSVANKEPNRDDFEAGAAQQPKRERLNDLELGLERKQQNSSFSANFYYMKYRDQLVMTGKINDVGAYTRINIPNSYRLGLELQAAAIFSKWLKASGNITVSENRISDLSEFIDDYDNGGQKVVDHGETDISFSPPVTGAATISITPFAKATIDFLSKFVGRQYLDNTSNSSRMLDPFFTEDLRVAYSFSKKRLKNIDLILQVSNIFDTRYEPNGYTFSYFYNAELVTENFYFPMAGRNVMVAVNVRL